jgi:hypothetical protein
MNRITRRDYLTRMGVGAAGIVGTAGLTFGKDVSEFPSSHVSERGTLGDIQAPKTQSVAPREWLRRHPGPFPSVPANQVVKLIFHGLAGFCWREDPRTHKISCDVGFFNKPDSYHRHRLMVHAYSASCTAVNLPTNVQKLSLIVTNRAILDEAYFYQPGNVSSRAELTDPKDFRWMMDLESDYFHGISLEKKPSVFKPILSVPCGLFYTHHKTGSRFRVQPAEGPPVNDLGNVADILAANVYVTLGASVELRVNDQPHAIQAPGEVHFNNHCHSGSACTPQPHNLQDRRKRSDFYMNYEAFDRKTEPEYQLYLLHTGTPNPPEGTSCKEYRILTEDRHAADREVIFLNDEAPCTGTGYGGGGGF